MAWLVEKAHQGGRRMGAYIAARDGVARALERGSLAHVRYERKALRDAYDMGYAEAVAEVKSSKSGKTHQIVYADGSIGHRKMRTGRLVAIA